MDERETRRRPPVAALTALALGLLIAVGAALGGALNFSGPRWVPGGLPSAKPLQGTRPPVDVQTPTPHAGSAAGTPPDLTWLAILLGSIALAVVAFFVVRWLLRRRRDRPEAREGDLEVLPDLAMLPDDPTIETSMPYLRRGLERALDSLDGSRRPTDAIIEAWLGLQEAAEDAGFQRQSAETPTEFTTRILRQVQVDPTSLATLRRLYLGVRFGDHVAVESDVADARAALVTLQTQWAATT